MTDYEIAYQACAGTSFVPEQRARYHAEEIAKTRASVRATVEEIGHRHGIPADLIATVAAECVQRADRAWRAWMGARSRCVSAMIVGPANFPARRMAKRGETEMKRGQEYFEAVKGAAHRATRRFGIKSDAGGIRTGSAGAVEALQKEIDAAEKRQETMKAANAAIRKHKDANDRRRALADLGFSSQAIEKMLIPTCFGTLGFESFLLSNNSANIRRLKGQLAAAQALAATSADYGWTVGDISAKVEDGRVWLIFPGKPDEESREKLKRAAFKWSPSRGAWVRADTVNARRQADVFKTYAMSQEQAPAAV
jgi:hypothetical protein